MWEPFDQDTRYMNGNLLEIVENCIWSKINSKSQVVFEHKSVLSRRVHEFPCMKYTIRENSNNVTHLISLQKQNPYWFMMGSPRISNYVQKYELHNNLLPQGVQQGQSTIKNSLEKSGVQSKEALGLFPYTVKISFHWIKNKDSNRLHDQKAQTVAQLPFKPALSIFHISKQFQNCPDIYDKVPCGYLSQT